MNTMKAVGMLLVVAALSSLAYAGAIPSPELDPSVAGTACTLIGGAVLILRSRRK